MATLTMDVITADLERNSILSISDYKIVDGGKYVVYCIRVTIDNCTWTVEHRYSDFAKFDVKRFGNAAYSFLPPKKLVRNMDPEFLTERRIELEKYIRTVFELELWLLKRCNQFTLPNPIAVFLDFHLYEIHSIVEDISIRLSVAGEKWLHASLFRPKFFEFKPVELYAIHQRMNLPETTLYTRIESDFANYVEFLHLVRTIKIRGSQGFVKSSNIVQNTLPVSLKICKSVLALWVADYDVKLIRDLQNIRKTCKRLVLHYSMEKLSDFLIKFNGDELCGNSESWSSLEEVDFSFNTLTEIDQSVIALQGVSKMNFAYNNLNDIGENLQYITTLSELILNGNKIQELGGWSMKLGNIKKLYLTKNRISSLKGLEKVLSLEYLNVQDNEISEPEEVAPVGNLPCLEHLILRGNPIRNLVEYRIKVIEHFEGRVREIFLDGKQASQHESDKVSVRLALKKVERETNNLRIHQK